MESRLNGPGDGFTTHAAAKMAEGIGGVLTTCTITGHHQTFIFELPGCYLVAEGTVGAHVIYSADGFTAAVVSDLLAYFEHGGTTSTPYCPRTRSTPSDGLILRWTLAGSRRS